MPEAVYGPGKTPEQCVRIVAELLEHGSGPVLLTRADDAQVKAATAIFGPGIQSGGCVLWRDRPNARAERVLIASAGTADTPVADEAAITLRAHGFDADRLHDIGVAGLHRLLAHLDRVTTADAVIVVAGMEGALASVIGGLTRGTGRRRADERRLRRRARRRDGAARDARVVRERRDGGRHRQRVRCGVRRGADAATMTGRTVWFNCCAGVAGDMLLASLVDAGADVDAIADGLAGLGVDGYAVAFERVQRCGVGATWANVAVHDEPTHDDGRTMRTHAHRPARDVLELIGSADLPDRVRERALAVYRALAEVEGEIHGIDADDVELHEVGALDSIIDVVGVCVALEVLGVDSIVCSPIAVGHGTVRTAHGELPNPVPAVTALLARAGAPVVGIDTTMETATPTGVALMTVLADRFGAFPPITVTATGFGAGTADPPGRPNVVQAVIGDARVRCGGLGHRTAGPTRRGQRRRRHR